MPEKRSLRVRDRVLAACGIVGVGGFAMAWIGTGWTRDGYSPVSDAISRLAGVDAPGRNWMTAGFVVFGIGVPLYAHALRKAVPGPAWITATLTGLATLGVAATPLGAADAAHYVFAIIGYATLAATPLLTARSFRHIGAMRWAAWSTACGTASAIFLALSALDPAHGLTQRIGLSITDGWIVATAWSMARHSQLPRSQRTAVPST
jgi:hypothetical membrane protein